MVASIAQLLLSDEDPWREHVTPVSLDRFRCEASGTRPDGTWVVRVGPACVSLNDALRWATAIASIADVGGPRVDAGHLRVPLPAGENATWPSDLEGDVQWDALPLRSWRVAGRVSLREGDFLKVAQSVLGSPPRLEVELDAQAWTASFDLVLDAPTLALAGEIAAHQFREQITGPDGLADEMGDCVAVVLTKLCSIDGRIDGLP